MGSPNVLSWGNFADDVSILAGLQRNLFKKLDDVDIVVEEVY